MSDAADSAHRGRAAFERRAWGEAYRQLAATDEQAALDAADLERLARAAYLTGRAAAGDEVWARAYQGFLERGEIRRAARCAFWLGMLLITGRGEEARGGGWIATAQRLVEEQTPEDCAERGFMLLPAALGELDDGDPDDAHAMFGRATAIGERFDEADLITLGRLGQGQALIRSGREQRGAELLDEAMVAIEADRVSPITAGLVYCGAIIACQQIFDLRRAQQWTAALSDWCATQPDLVAFRGQCQVHRSELATLRGDWVEAVRAAEQACEWQPDPPDSAAGLAFYQRAELHRLRGEYGAAEAAFGQAASLGRDPQPGLALLRLAQGRTDAAVGAIRRVVAETPDPYPDIADEISAPRSRAEVLGACVEIMLAAGDRQAARAACAELEAIADSLDTPLITAVSGHARGAVLLAEDQPSQALAVLTEARATWEQLRAPYERARTRELIARALRALGDEDTATMELAAAARVFEEVGARPDLERLDRDHPRGPRPAAGLTAREIEVVRLVAAGHTNQQIAEELVISDKTVARHLHNVFSKLDLPNRAAATAYAYEHELV